MQNAAQVPEFLRDYLVVKRLVSWLVLHLLCWARDHAKGFALCLTLCLTRCPIGPCLCFPLCKCAAARARSARVAGAARVMNVRRSSGGGRSV